MGSPPRVKIIIPDVPPATRRALAVHAEQRDVSRNEAVVGILAQHYRIKHETGSSRYRPWNLDNEGPWSLDVPEKVRSALRLDAARKGATIQGLVRNALAEALGLPPEVPMRRPRKTGTREQPEVRSA